MTHTKGPWRLVWWGNDQYPLPLSILANNDEQWVTNGGCVSSEANARLIAAAPDLLEALRAAKTWLEGWASAESELAIIDAAISKAEGTSQ